MTPEKIFENKVKSFLNSEGAWYVKYFANRNTKSGIPDILACVNGYFVGLETKAQHGSPSALQEYNCLKIREAGGYAYIVYPSGFEKLKLIIYGLNCDRVPEELPLIIK